MTAAVQACFAHRYDELLSQGLVDNRTRLIDRDELLMRESRSMRLKLIAKELNVTPEDIKCAKALERQLVFFFHDTALT